MLLVLLKLPMLLMSLPLLAAGEAPLCTLLMLLPLLASRYRSFTRIPSAPGTSH